MPTELTKPVERRTVKTYALAKNKRCVIGLEPSLTNDGKPDPNGTEYVTIRVEKSKTVIRLDIEEVIKKALWQEAYEKANEAEKNRKIRRMARRI